MHGDGAVYRPQDEGLGRWQRAEELGYPVDRYAASAWPRPCTTSQAARADREAYDEIVRCSGAQFDPQVVEAFKARYDEINEIRQQLADSA